MELDEDKLIGNFYEAVAEPDRWSAALECVRSMFGCVGAVVAFVDPTAPQLLLGTGAGIWDAEVLARYARDFAAIDPLVPRFALAPCGKAISSRELLTADETQRDVFFNEFYRPMGLTETLAARMTDGSGAFGIIGLHRDSGRPEFDQADAAKLERLVPHIGRALRLRQAFWRRQIQASDLASVVDRMNGGVIVLGAQGQPIHVNVAARRFVARKDGMSLDRGGRLRAAHRAADRLLVGLQESVLQGQSGGLVQIPREGDARPYAALVATLPAEPDMIRKLGEDRVGVLILVHDPDATSATPAQALAEVFGLTPRAADLTAALAAGEELKNYAKRAGLTLNTARYHLKVVSSRTGARSQAQLVRLAVRASADLLL